MLRIQSTLSSWREYLSPVTHVSTFKQTGEITPEEFVLAGDYLVYKFPTWSWSSAPASKRRDFLPPNKQFLVTKHVPSHVRAQATSGAYGHAGKFSTLDDERTDEDGWTISYLKSSDAGEGAESKATSGNTDKHEIGGTEDEDDGSVLDIDDMEANELDDSGYLPNTAGSLPDSSRHNDLSAITVPNRSYNLYITYSTSYRVPKMYLSGFNSSGSPLTPDEMFEDIVSEYKDKTVTIESAPFLENSTMVSIHPCRHAGVMKMLLSRAEARQRRLKATKREEERARLRQEDLLAGVEGLGLDSEDWEDVDANAGASDNEEGSEEAIRVDQYLVIFLKFISSVTPGIEHDNTMTAL
ncbi:autophagocytosis associated protein [Dipodascopsis uninucleata]